MTYRVQDFCRSMEELAPLELALEWDNVGLQIGNPSQRVSAVVVTLTVTLDVVKRAIESGANLLIAHHPVIFKPLRQIRTDSPEGALLAALLQDDLAVYVAHTNLDQAGQGLNHWLARDLGLREEEVLVPAKANGCGLGRVGKIPPVGLGDLAKQVEVLWGSPVRVVGDLGLEISTVAVVGGSGGDFAQQAREAGADCLITGDVSYHDAMDARNLGMAVLDAGHFATEKLVTAELGRYLADYFGDSVRILQDNSGNPFSF
ncbi:MAG: Nif3-like dinuclear metal center hexameric protein [Limnochordia bacterium]|nr:Nif3-like dinuclear metal center hexameric protein [Limnochordia bacterium]